MNKKRIIITLALLIGIILICAAAYAGGDLLVQSIMNMHAGG